MAGTAVCREVLDSFTYGAGMGPDGCAEKSLPV